MSRIPDGKKSSWGAVVVWLVTLLGVWLIFSPSVFQARSSGQVFWNELIVGLLLAFLGIVTLRNANFRFPEGRRNPQLWIALLLGLWLIVSPWALNSAAAKGVVLNEVVVGFVVATASALILFSRSNSI